MEWTGPGWGWGGVPTSEKSKSGNSLMIAEMGLRPSHTNLPQRSRHSSRTRMRGAAVTCPWRASGEP